MINLFTPANAVMLLIDHQIGTIRLAISTIVHATTCVVAGLYPVATKTKIFG